MDKLIFGSNEFEIPQGPSIFRDVMTVKLATDENLSFVRQAVSGNGIILQALEDGTIVSGYEGYTQVLYIDRDNDDLDVVTVKLVK